MTDHVLMVERAQTNRPLFGDALKKRYSVATASSGKRALELAAELSPRVVVLDAISLRTPGDRICQLLHDQLPKIPLIHLHPGPKETVQSCADIVLVEKFTSRKLINAIERLLHGKMAPAPDDTLACGPFTLHLKRRLLVFRGQETSLSPKLAQLVELFLRHPGETLDRKRLMEHVWNTDYLGDTRTLDVHIRYIRCAVESNPGKPVYFRTVRGVGYRLEILDHPQKHAVPESALEVIS